MVAGAPEALLADGTLSEATFDVVCALEVLEHVADDGAFVAACARLARAGGDVFLSTLNRTPLAAAASITIAEGALGLLPRGTHDAAKFRTPGDVAALLGAAGCRVRDARALHFAPAPRGPGAAWLGGGARAPSTSSCTRRGRREGPRGRPACVVLRNAVVWPGGAIVVAPPRWPTTGASQYEKGRTDDRSPSSRDRYTTGGHSSAPRKPG